ncbi:hypothetical protein MtrunA17_Chr7g0274911 [Medicago truncatula]|uniref:Uncharacterized protein n=1 Tax=Medicago truncatula TaxID=3880 RepID=A0A396H9X6_MEDTR|nr:hypothetical protein MtrunA17_Chr7g0274911 [Medicago truncatula]
MDLQPHLENKDFSALMSAKLSQELHSPEKQYKVDINSAIYHGGPPVPTRAPKMLNFVDTEEMVRGPEAGPSLRIRWLGSGNEKMPVIKSKRVFFLKKQCSIYIFLKEKYKVPYICGTPKGENDHRIHEEPPPNTKSKRT